MVLNKQKSLLAKPRDPVLETGEALKGFWTNAVAIPAAPARPAIAVDWYRSFLELLLNTQSYTWFAKPVAYGELLIASR